MYEQGSQLQVHCTGRISTQEVHLFSQISVLGRIRLDTLESFSLISRPVTQDKLLVEAWERS